MQIESLTFLADENASFWFPESASTFAEDVDWTYDLILWISLVFFVGIVAFMIWCMIKYVKKNGVKAESQITHNTPLELAWSILPSFLLVWMFVQGSLSFLDMRTAPEGANEIGVKAYKWGWSMDYGKGAVHPELHVLLNEPTKLTMQSDDVIHSLYIPAFRVKKDIVPGRYNYMWIEPPVASEKVSEKELADAKKETGSAPWDYKNRKFTPDGYKFYDLYCTEYCGKDHSKMQTVVVVHESREDLDAWIKEASTYDPDKATYAEWGNKLYNQRGCAGCHSIDGSKRTGPSFQNSYGNKRELADGSKVLFDENYVRESILNPKAKIAKDYPNVMPSFQGQFSEDDIDGLIAFIKQQSDAAKEEEAKPDAEAAEKADAEAEADSEE